ncbi:MAG TPA: DUF4384 domain-containing protein [Blastocatellia bacterium]|nr:DUF4384 domain-containing protein [Blastocatellia bacterium]
MRSRLSSYLLVGLLSGGLVTPFTAAEPSTADGNPNFWDQPVKFTQPAKPKSGRVRPASRPKPDSSGLEEGPLLAVKYNVLKRGDGNSPERVDHDGQFKIGDQVKLAITPNQSGFLYVVHRSVGLDGKIIDQPNVIFPDPRINNGMNAVEKDREYVVPQYCQDYPDPKDCWWEITPPNGKEFFTVIFSRDEITALPNKLTRDDVVKGSNAVNEELIEAIKKSSGQILAHAEKGTSSQRRTSSDSVYVRNTNRKDNEELIDTIELKHLLGGDDQPAALTRALFVKKRSDAMRVLFSKNGLPVDPSRDVFKAGDEIEVKYESNFRGYAYFVNITPEGKKCLIAPCSRAEISEMVPGSLYKQTVGFDEEKGTEVLQVVLSRERIKFLDDAITSAGCCDPSRPCGCELSANAASAAAQLASNAANKKGGIVVNDIVAVVPQSGSGGVGTRGIKLAAGRDKQEGSFVAIEDEKNDNRLEAGQAAVFEIRLNHK